jgi:hypothetical protein
MLHHSASPMRAILLFGVIALLAACNSSPETQEYPLVFVVDARGAPIKGALVMPESEDEGVTNSGNLTASELERRTSDAQGLVRADLKAYYWPSDACFHFATTKQGYEDSVISVSKDLFPSPLKIRMEVVENTGNGKPGPKASASATN